MVLAKTSRALRPLTPGLYTISAASVALVMSSPPTYMAPASGHHHPDECAVLPLKTSVGRELGANVGHVARLAPVGAGSPGKLQPAQPPTAALPV